MSVSGNTSDILSSDQQTAADMFDNFIEQRDNLSYYLLGHAGTGKSFLSSRIINICAANDKISEISICAPTHKALNVIETYIRQHIDEKYYSGDEQKIKFATVHKKLGFRPTISTRDGTLLFSAKSKPASKTTETPNKTTILFIDECSMISKSMSSSIKNYVSRNKCHVIFTGDILQLPPVGESESVIFSEIPDDYPFRVHMTKILRTKRKSIQDACAVVRDWDGVSSIYEKLKPIYKNSTDRSFRLMRLNKGKNYSEKWINHIVARVQQNGTPMILTWDNETSNTCNNIIRNEIHGESSAGKYSVGDHIMFNEFYMPDIDNRPDLKYYTSDTAIIDSVEYNESVIKGWAKYKIEDATKPAEKMMNKLLDSLETSENILIINMLVAKKNRNDDLDNICVVRSIAARDAKKFSAMKNKICEKIKFFYAQTRDKSLADKLWKAYRELYIDEFASITFGYSITTYKSQGSTYSSVYIHMRNMSTIRNNMDLKKALITAFGRARHELILLV